MELAGLQIMACWSCHAATWHAAWCLLLMPGLTCMSTHTSSSTDILTATKILAVGHALHLVCQQIEGLVKSRLTSS